MRKGIAIEHNHNRSMEETKTLRPMSPAVVEYSVQRAWRGMGKKERKRQSRRGGKGEKDHLPELAIRPGLLKRIWLCTSRFRYKTSIWQFR